jgi:hypothetical protein
MAVSAQMVVGSMSFAISQSICHSKDMPTVLPSSHMVLLKSWSQYLGLEKPSNEERLFMTAQISMSK